MESRAAAKGRVRHAQVQRSRKLWGQAEPGRWQRGGLARALRWERGGIDGQPVAFQLKGGAAGLPVRWIRHSQKF